MDVQLYSFCSFVRVVFVFEQECVFPSVGNLYVRNNAIVCEEGERERSGMELEREIWSENGTKHFGIEVRCRNDGRDNKKANNDTHTKRLTQTHTQKTCVIEPKQKTNIRNLI